ncbi:hypothetical protein [Aeromicrobium flavum]|uniref:hypothetical protein n=1 Tax=Aeromicrobium flavum TaxID=416568 RepID=UPI0011BDADC4|nr:hypothetical protein [Aeromicrobium flavum]
MVLLVAGCGPTTVGETAVDRTRVGLESSCAELLEEVIEQTGTRPSDGSTDRMLDVLGHHCPKEYPVFVDYQSIRGTVGLVGDDCPDPREVQIDAEALALAKRDGLCSAARTVDETAEQEWTCSWSPTMNEDWYDDVLCSDGTREQRPRLREWDSFVTPDEMMESARKYEGELNRR